MNKKYADVAEHGHVCAGACAYVFDLFIIQLDQPMIRDDCMSHQFILHSAPTASILIRDYFVLRVRQFDERISKNAIYSAVLCPLARTHRKKHTIIIRQSNATRQCGVLAASFADWQVTEFKYPVKKMIISVWSTTRESCIRRIFISAEKSTYIF